MVMRILLALILLALTCVPGQQVNAKEPTLTISFGAGAKVYRATDLLALKDAADVTIEHDIAYKGPMTYRAVPLLDLLGDFDKEPFDTLEARATDGFVSQIPLALVRKARDGGAIPWIAIETAKKPWPDMPGRSFSPGPFFMVWQHADRSGVGPEQWPYALAQLTGVESPFKRWPQMVVAASLPADAPERRGAKSFIKNCLSCHRLNGAGEGDMGPDLDKPMNATEYMTPIGLRRLIRDPASVRTWPTQVMQGFDKTVLPDNELDDLIAYLKYIARK
jgi:mono/diheme cytochrome c family protein